MGFTEPLTSLLPFLDIVGFLSAFAADESLHGH